MRQIMVLLHPHRPQSRAACREVCADLLAAGIEPIVLAEEHRVMAGFGEAPDAGVRVVDDADLAAAASESELVIVLGGDGTILRAAERFHAFDIPVMGVNLGHVGFLAESEREDLGETVRRVVARDYDVEQRLALDVEVTVGGRTLHRSWALNEATVEKGARTQMIELAVGVDDRPVSTFGCDGVILATPTGSTAYAFSAGGPIVWPEVEALLMVPISAHALFAEPLVVSPHSTIGVEILDRPAKDRAVLWCDGRIECEVPAGAHIEARRSAHPLTLARLRRGPFTDRLVNKFHLPVSGWRGPEEQA